MCSMFSFPTNAAVSDNRSTPDSNGARPRKRKLRAAHEPFDSTGARPIEVRRPMLAAISCAFLVRPLFERTSFACAQAGDQGAAGPITAAGTERDPSLSARAVWQPRLTGKREHL